MRSFLLASFYATLLSCGTTGEAKQKTLRVVYWCGPTFDEAMTLASAIRSRDTQAVASLIRSGRALQLAQGTEVSAVAVDDSISSIYVRSGTHIDRRCFIASNALQ